MSGLVVLVVDTTALQVAKDVEGEHPVWLGVVDGGAFRSLHTIGVGAEGGVGTSSR